MANDQRARGSAPNGGGGMIYSQSMGTPIAGQLAVQALVELDGLSYDDYFKKIEQMINDLRGFWRLEQRVKSLKIAIQLTKLLADTSQMKLYSKKYKMITELLDEFGQLIYKRIQLKAEGKDECNNGQTFGAGTSTYSPQHNHHHQHLTQDYQAMSCKEQAKETCRNWFMKIASIRELVPRFYTELAILKTCDFLLKPQSSTSRGVITISVEQFFIESLKRLTKAAWGFGDPVVSVYARVYLCKVAEKLIGWTDEETNEGTSVLFNLLSMNLEASAVSISRLDTRALLRSLQVQSFDLVQFFDLLSNGLQSIINFVTLRNDIYTHNDQLIDSAKLKLESMFRCLIDKLVTDNVKECSILARNIIIHAATRSLPADIVANNANEILEAIKTTHKVWKQTTQYDDTNNLCETRSVTLTIYSVMESFAIALDESEVFEVDSDAEEVRTSILSTIELVLEDLFDYETSPLKMTSAATCALSLVPSEMPSLPQASSNYFKCLKAWLSYANHYVDRARTDILLTRFVVRIKSNRQYVSHHSTIIDLIKALVANKRTIEELKQVFSLKSFFQLLDLLRKDDHKFEATKWILETMRANLKLNKQQLEPIIISGDKTMISFVLRLAAILNDSLSLLMANDDIGHLSQLIIFFLDRIRIEDFKEHLQFYSRCRSSMCNLIPVLEYLAKQSFVLALEFRKVEKKRNMRRNFLNGCLAFTFVTIPAIYDPLTRSSLYIEGSRLALDQMSFSLADYYIKQALINFESEESKKQTYNDGNNIDKRLQDSHGFSVHSKQQLDQLQCLLDLMLDFEDHIDLKHKLVLTQLIKNSFSEHLNLIESVKRLNVIGDDDDDADVNDGPLK